AVKPLDALATVLMLAANPRGAAHDRSPIDAGEPLEPPRPQEFQMMIHQLLNLSSRAPALNDPYRELTDFSRRLLTDFEPRMRGHVPVDIRDEGDSFVLEADLPGFAPADVEIVAAPELL